MVVPPGPPRAVGGGVPDRTGRTLGVGVGGHPACSGRAAAKRFDRVRLVEHDRGERDADMGLADRPGQVAGSGGGQDRRDHGVNSVVGCGQFQALTEGASADSRGRVDRPGNRAPCRHQPPEPPPGRWAHGVDGQPGLGAGVGRQYPGTAHIGHDHNTAAGRNGPGGQQCRRVQQLAQAGGGDDPGLPEQRLAADQRRGHGRR